jgi:hypothetical protein
MKINSEASDHRIDAKPHIYRMNWTESDCWAVEYRHRRGFVNTRFYDGKANAFAGSRELFRHHYAAGHLLTTNSGV